MKFGFGWPSGFREEEFGSNGHVHLYSPGTGADGLLGAKSSQNINFLFIWSFSASLLLMSLLVVW